jgi:tRNA pseudouridine13 synthase
MIESIIELNLPYVTADLPGVGGQLRVTPDHFVVEECPLYEAEGSGAHLYVNVTKVGFTTKEVQRQLAQLVGLPPGEVGYAGLKDKQARTTQTFSLPVERLRPPAVDELVARIPAELPLTLNWAKRHKNKLRPGHLLGNHFRITVTNLAVNEAEAQQRVEAITQRLQRSGLPNFFGPQRFGAEGGNVGKGLEILLERRQVRDHWLRRFLLSSYQAYLCNRYLARRLEMEAFAHLLAGDIAKKHDTGGMFEVADAEVEQPRYMAQVISFTAPLYGSKMWAAQAAAGELEAAILAEAGLTLGHFGKAKVEGSRRLGRLFLQEWQATVADNQLVLAFFLPKGAFATTLLRELMKTDLAGLPDDGDDDL